MWTFLVIGLLTAGQPAVEVQTLGGDVVTGPLVELGAERVTVQTADGPVTLKTETLLGLSPVDSPADANVQPGVWVELVDGSSLVGMDYSARAGRTRITMLDGKLFELSSRDVATVRLQPQTDTVAAEWLRILEMGATSDLLVIRKADSIDYHQGTLRNVTETTVEFELEGEVLPVKRTKVHGLLHYQSAGRDLPEPLCRVIDAAGSRWAVRSISLVGDNVQWTTLLGLEVTRPVADVTRIDFSHGKILYLSDLKPESVEWTPYFGTGKSLPVLFEFFGPREDRSLEPGLLELEGKRYRKGLALHSRTSLVYRLPGRFRRLKAIVGIDDRVRPRGNVRLVIRGDDRVLLETDVAGTDPPKPVDLDLVGVRRLAILVDFGDDLDVADHLDLCKARILK